MIKFLNVNVEVNDGRNKRNILEDITLTFPSKGFISLSGKSGSGKSTILNLIACNIKKTSGEISVFNIDFDKMLDTDEDYLRRSIVSYITQDNNLFNNLSAKDNISIGLNLIGKKLSDVEVEYNKYSKMLNIESLLEEKVENLSGGERQRISILIAILRNSLIYLCDEPTSSLDYENSVIILDVLKEISKTKLVIVSTHDLELINKYEDGNVELSYGKVISTKIDIKEEKIEYPSKKYKPVSIKKIGTKIFFKQKFRQIISIFLLMISMILFIVSLYNVSYNKYSFTYDSYKSLDCDINIISDIDDISENEINIDNYKEYGYSDNYNEFYYNCNIITYNDILNDGNNDVFVKNVMIDKSLENNEIVLTDYLYENLGISEEQFQFNNYTYTIKEVEKTTYDIYKTLDTPNQIPYRDSVDLWYPTIKVNQETFDSMLNQKLKYVSYGSSNIYASDASLLDELAHMAGAKEVEENEILIDVFAYRKIYGKAYDSDESITWDKTVCFTINGESKEYTIVGLVTGPGLKDGMIYFSDEEYKTLSEGNSISVDLPFLSIPTNNKNSFIDTLKIIDQNEHDLVSPYSNSLEDCMNEREFLKSISIYLLICSLLLLITIGIYLNTSHIKSNLRTIGILRNYGSTRKNIGLMFLIDGSISYGISIILAIVSYLVYIKLNNNAYIRNTLFDNNILTFKIWIILLFIIVCILVEVVILGINLKNIKKLNNRKLMAKY